MYQYLVHRVFNQQFLSLQAKIELKYYILVVVASHILDYSRKRPSQKWIKNPPKSWKSVGIFIKFC